MVKDAVEKFLNLKFNMTNQKVINDSINDNPVPALANVHICRIAEEMCFLQIYQKFEKFDINFEARRIKRILDIISNPKWRGEWIESSRDKQFENIFDNVINRSPESVDSIPSTSTSTSTSDGNRRSRSSDTVVEELGTENVNINNGTPSSPPQIVATNLKMSEVMTIYDEKYPILSQMLRFYSNLTKLRNETYKDAEISVTYQKNFNWKLYSDLNIFEKEKAATLLKDFPFFADLSHIDKSFLLNRFWTSFWFFERICDTLVTFGDTSKGNFVMLQDKSIYDLDALIKENNFGNRKEWKKVEEILFGYWKRMLKMMKELKPDILEIMYIFCCILWNLSFLNVNLSEDGEEVVRRGRLIIHTEMREFYDFDDSRWQRIHSLQNILLLTEKSVKEYKKSYVVVVA
uniref:NR LBD domain-containing protein n=1 Tax=Panagrolaimus superbus TaxID=310955 RepID=A0A914YWQ3_9BILA